MKIYDNFQKKQYWLISDTFRGLELSNKKEYEELTDGMKKITKVPKSVKENLTNDETIEKAFNGHGAMVGKIKLIGY